MTYEYNALNLGTTANDKTGDSFRTAFTKIDSMLEELMVTKGLVSSVTAALVYASPTDSVGQPTFRALKSSDYPTVITAATAGLTGIPRITYNSKGQIVHSEDVPFDSSNLSNSGVVSGTYGSSTEVIQLTVDAKGIVTGVSNLSVAVAASGVVAGTYGTSSFVQLDIGSDGRVTSATNVAILNTDLPASGVVAGTYGSSVYVPQITVDDKGIITGVAEFSVSAPIIPNYYKSGTLSYASTTEITMTRGYNMSDSTNSVYIATSTNITITELDAGSFANDTWYYVYLISKVDGTYKAILSTVDESVTGSITLPSGYVYKRQINAAVMTNGSAQFRNFSLFNDHMFLSTSINIVTAATYTTSTTVDISSVLPASLIKSLDITTKSNSSSRFVYISNTGIPAVFPTVYSLINISVVFGELFILNKYIYYYVTSSNSANIDCVGFTFKGAV